MFCNNCHAEIPTESKFCPVCGREVIKNKLAKNSAVRCDSKKDNIFTMAILSVGCCILISILLLSTITIFTFRESINPSRISSLIDNVEVNTLIEYSDIDKLVNSSVTGADVSRIYRKGTFQEYIKNTLSDYSAYILEGTIPEGVNGDDIVSLMRENSYLIEETSGYELRERDYKEIRDFFDTYGKNVLGVFSSDIRVNGIMKTIRILCSTYLIVAFIVIMVLLLLLLIKVRKRNCDTILWFGITFLVSSVVFCVLGVVSPIVLGIISKSQYIIRECVNLYFGNILGIVLGNCGLLLLMGVALVFVYIIIKRYKKLKENNFVI